VIVEEQSAEILIVDDDPQVLGLMGRLLENQGIRASWPATPRRLTSI
jgi:DNA-binding response OmpR family regulator